MLKRRKCRVQSALLSGVLSCPSVSLPTVGQLLTPHPAAGRALFLKGIPATWESLGCSLGRGGAHTHPLGSERPTGKCGLGLKSCCHGGLTCLHFTEPASEATSRWDSPGRWARPGPQAQEARCAPETPTRCP